MLTNEWQCKSKRWGHPLHSMCSYMGMFPPRLPHYFIQKFTHRGDVVFDPFCGRGTTPLQACVEGRVGIGLDLNPLACALTRAKVTPVDPLVLRDRIEDLSNDMFFAPVDAEPDAIRMLFHEKTLSQLVYLKQHLDPDDPVDAFLLGTLLGMLHGGAKGSKPRKTSTRKRRKPPTFLSIPMPNTFSMSPDYIRRYVEDKGLEKPALDVFTCLRARVDHLLRLGPPPVEGRVWQGRIQDLAELPDPAFKRKRVQLTISSPPYLKVLKYGLYNWIRLWFLDEDPGELDRRLDQHRSLDLYLEFLRDTCRALYRVTAKGGVCALVIGDVKRGKKEPLLLAEEVWAYLKKKRTPWKKAQIVEDAVPSNAKVTRIWGDEKRGQATAIDRILVLYKSEYNERPEPVGW